MKRSKPLDVSAFAGTSLAGLFAILPPEMVEEAIAKAVTRLDMTAEKLALLIIRAVAPDEVIGQVEESKLRGVRPETLKQHKDREELPLLINGIQPRQR